MWLLLCGPFTFEFAAEADYVSYTSETGTLTLAPTTESTPGEFPQGAKIRVVLPKASGPSAPTFDIAINLVVEPCRVEKFAFKQSKLELSYLIGDDPIISQLPEITQSPNCGYPIMNVAII